MKFFTQLFFVATPNATTLTFLNSQNGFKESLTQNLFPHQEIISRQNCACMSFSIRDIKHQKNWNRIHLIKNAILEPSKLQIVLATLIGFLSYLVDHTQIWLPVIIISFWSEMIKPILWLIRYNITYTFKYFIEWVMQWLVILI